jgi:hypothetical protein
MPLIAWQILPKLPGDHKRYLENLTVLEVRGSVVFTKRLIERAVDTLLTIACKGVTRVANTMKD